MSGNQHKHQHAHRGSVSDLFGGSGGSATAAAADGAVSAVQTKETRDGGAGVVRRNENAREPRLLPFAPGMSFAFSPFYSFGNVYAIFFLPLQLHITSRTRNIILKGWGC